MTASLNFAPLQLNNKLQCWQPDGTLAGSGLTTYAYDNANRKIGTVLGNGSTETDSYNASGDLVDIWHKTAGGSTITRQQYTIDSAGRRVGESLNGGASSVAYTFDNGGQLTNEVRTGANSYTASYTYDAAGNRASKTLGGTTENYTYDNANKLLTAGGKTYSYDGAGNTTSVSSSSGTTNLTWDGGGRLKSAVTPSGTYTYTSNGIGQRVAKSGPSGSKSYVLGSDAIDAQVLSDGAASYVYAGGLVSEVRGGTSKFYHSDALGTTRAITNGSGTTTDSLTTDAFGMTVSGSGSTPTPFGFAGQAGYQSDPETGLMRLGHRYYDNSTGHFISRDPIRDGYNWYAYCGNDPVNAIDPTGQFGILIAIVAAILLLDIVAAPAGPKPSPGWRPPPGPGGLIGGWLPGPIGRVLDLVGIVNDPPQPGDIDPPMPRHPGGGGSGRGSEPGTGGPKVPPGGHQTGPGAPPLSGGPPDGVYTHIPPKRGTPKQNGVYDGNGDLIAHVDWDNHGVAPPGHGHKFPPGRPSVGHGKEAPHFLPGDFPDWWGYLGEE
jgi:RHS repeat-associated protein